MAENLTGGEIHNRLTPHRRSVRELFLDVGARPPVDGVDLRMESNDLQLLLLLLSCRR